MTVLILQLIFQLYNFSAFVNAFSTINKELWRLGGFVADLVSRKYF
jgi:hypothetical protein